MVLKVYLVHFCMSPNHCIYSNRTPHKTITIIIKQQTNNNDFDDDGGMNK